MSSREFKNKKHLRGVSEHVNGTGTIAVTLDFLPDYLTASVKKGKATAGDSIYWTLATADVGVTYTFTVHYTLAAPCDILWLAAKLPKNAEIIAH